MKKDRLRLFRMVRKGYDPEEVLECFWDIVTAFSTREKQHTRAEEIFIRENMELKIKIDEGQACIKSLQSQLEQLTKENIRLSLRLAPEAPTGISGGDGA